MTTLEAKYTYATWSPATKTWEGTWTATYCEVGHPQKELNILIGCHSNEGNKCPNDVAYLITVTECTIPH